MKIILIAIGLVVWGIFGSCTLVEASSEKWESRELNTVHTQHPPHDHHQTDHIKKLDESMRRKQEDDEWSD